MVEPRTALTFDVKVQSALHIGQAPLATGEYQFTQRHIPGSVLRGALAEVLITQGMTPGQDAVFDALFDGPEAVHFEPAYPAAALHWSYPFPATARYCKHHGGFPPPDASAEEARHYHGVFDTLISQAVFETYLEHELVPHLEKALCPHCWKSVEPATGIYLWRGAADGSPGPAATQLERHTYTAINRARSVAEDQMLFTLETIEPETMLHGCVWVPSEHSQVVRDALSCIRFLGRGRTRGQGQVCIELSPTPVPDDTETRICALNQQFQAEFALYATLTGCTFPEAEKIYFTLDLLSPAILGNGAAATLIPPDLAVDVPATLVRRFVAPEVIGGWWNAARLPYATALAAKAGSVFLYAVPADVNLAQLSTALDALRAEGWGQFRERGYGALMACAPFHLWTAEKEANR